jgi:hypothetical protein
VAISDRTFESVEWRAQAAVFHRVPLQGIDNLRALAGCGIIAACVIIFGEMRANGCLTGILVYCADCQCSYSMSAD